MVQSQRAGIRGEDGLLHVQADMLDDIARLAGMLCDAPSAFVTSTGSMLRRTPGDGDDDGASLDDLALRLAQEARTEGDAAVFGVPDLGSDTRFHDHPLVVAPDGLRFLAGVSVDLPEEAAPVVLYVADRRTRQLTADQLSGLQALARQVAVTLRLALSRQELWLNTETREAERKVREEADKERRVLERFMYATLDSIHEHVVIIDRHGEIVHANRAWTAFGRVNAGATPFIGRGLGANYIDECDRAAARGVAQAAVVAHALRRAIDGEDMADFALEYDCHSGKELRWFSVRLSAFGEKGQEFVVVSHQNVTERVLARKELSQINAALEARVENRTRQLDIANSSLRASEEKFRTIFEDAVVGTVVADGEGRLLQVNRSFCAMVAHEPAQMLGRDLPSMLHEWDRAPFAARLAELFGGRLPGFGVEVRLMDAKGQAVWVHASVSAVSDTTGEVRQMIALVQNISERKKAQHQRDRFFELSVDMFVIMDFHGRILHANPACTRTLGHAYTDLNSQVAQDLVHPDDRALVRAQMRNLIHGELTRNLDARIRMASGDYCPVRFSAAPWTDDGLIVVVGRDMTEFQEAQTALRERQSMLTRAEQMSHMGSWFWDLQTDRLTYSSGLLALTAQSQQTGMVGLGALLALVEEGDRAGLRAAIDKVVGTGAAREMVCGVQRHDGVRRVFRIFLEAHGDVDGGVRGVSGACLDVTEYRQALQQLRQSERQLRALTARLQTIREEERSGISREIHDELGQMLTALKMDMTLLARDLDRPGAKDAGKVQVLDSLRSMRGLVDATLDSVRRIARQLRPEVLDALGLFPALEWQASEFQARAGLRCTVAFPAVEPQLGRDQRTALFRIAQEAMTNAVRHAGASSIHVSLRQDGDDLLLEVRDDGCGMVVPVPGDVTSLGLLGMRERAAMVGGVLEIAGEPGQGTTIGVRLPVQQPHDAGAADAAVGSAP